MIWIKEKSNADGYFKITNPITGKLLTAAKSNGEFVKKKTM